MTWYLRTHKEVAQIQRKRFGKTLEAQLAMSESWRRIRRRATRSLCGSEKLHTFPKSPVPSVFLLAFLTHPNRLWLEVIWAWYWRWPDLVRKLMNRREWSMRIITSEVEPVYLRSLIASFSASSHDIHQCHCFTRPFNRNRAMGLYLRVRSWTIGGFAFEVWNRSSRCHMRRPAVKEHPISHQTDA